MTTTTAPVHFRCSVRNVLHVAGLDMSPVFATYFEADAYGSLLAQKMHRPGVRFDVSISETADPVTHKCLGGQVCRLDGEFPVRLTVESATQQGFGF